LCTPAARQTPRCHGGEPSPDLAEPLTGCELEVLRLLAAGQVRPAHRHDLVAIDTVKMHVTHVLGKLGATDRTEAVARARAAGPGPLTPHPSLPGSTFG
jgi:LuxR family maltose regulon positive regulatory protein